MSSNRERHRGREDTGDRRTEDRKHRRHKSRSRSRNKKRRREGGTPAVTSVPPQEWLGPRDARGAPPAEWRGPPGYGGMPPGAYPPPRGPPDWFGDRGPPQRPPGNFPGMSPMSRGQVPPEYVWPGMPTHPGDPPPEWRGPAMRPPYGSRAPGDPAEMWAQRPLAPQGPFAPPGFPGTSQREADQISDSRGPGSEQAQVPVSTLPSDPSTTAGARLSQADDVDDDKPPPRTVADRFHNVRIVRSALGESLITYLKSQGVKVASPLAQAAAANTGPEEVGPTEEAAMTRECSRLGLDGGAQRARLPMPGPLKLPVCTAALSHLGLWDRFRQRCGTPLPAEPQLPFEIKKSPGGGQVVVPLALAASSTPTPAVACN